MNHSYERYAKLLTEGSDVPHTDKSAYVLGNKLASMAAACLLISEAHIPGDKIYIFADVIEDNKNYPLLTGHDNLTWKLLYNIGEFAKIHKYNESGSRGIEFASQECMSDISDKTIAELVRFMVISDDRLMKNSIESMLDDDFFTTDIWRYIQMYYSLNRQHSAYQLKAAVIRSISCSKKGYMSECLYLPDGEYDSMIIPMVNYLAAHGVRFVSEEIKDITTIHEDGKDYVTEIITVSKTYNVKKEDNVYIEPGSGGISNGRERASYIMWESLAGKISRLSNPTPYMSNAKISLRKTLNIKINHGETVGIFKDMKKLIYNESPWRINIYSEGINKSGELLISLKAINNNVKGRYVRASYNESDSREIMREWLSYVYRDNKKIDEVIDKSNIISYSDAFEKAPYMPVSIDDKISCYTDTYGNMAFVGSYTDVRECLSSPEYQCKSAAIAVYALTCKEELEQTHGFYADIDNMMLICKRLMRGRKISEINLPVTASVAVRKIIKKLEGTEIEASLNRHGIYL